MMNSSAKDIKIQYDLLNAKLAQLDRVEKALKQKYGTLGGDTHFKTGFKLEDMFGELWDQKHRMRRYFPFLSDPSLPYDQDQSAALIAAELDTLRQFREWSGARESFQCDVDFEANQNRISTLSRIIHQMEAYLDPLAKEAEQSSPKL